MNIDGETLYLDQVIDNVAVFEIPNDDYTNNYIDYICVDITGNELIESGIYYTLNIGGRYKIPLVYNIDLYGKDYTSIIYVDILPNYNKTMEVFEENKRNWREYYFWEQWCLWIHKKAISNSKKSIIASEFEKLSKYIKQIKSNKKKKTYNLDCEMDVFKTLIQKINNKLVSGKNKQMVFLPENLIGMFTKYECSIIMSAMQPNTYIIYRYEKIFNEFHYFLEGTDVDQYMNYNKIIKKFNILYKYTKDEKDEKEYFKKINHEIMKFKMGDFFKYQYLNIS